MKKNIFLYSALALGMTGMFASCSSDDVVEVSGGNTGTDATAQVINIAVENTGDLSTRVTNGRPLNSEEAKQTIENVAIIITDEDGTIVWTHKDKDWTSNGNDYSTGGHGKEDKITIEPKLSAGDYKVFAIGYHNSSHYKVGTASLNDYITNLSKEVSGSNINTLKANIVLSNDDTNNEAEEIFAGATDLKVEEGIGFNKNVYLHRQVAGIYTYVTAIPYIESEGKVGDMLKLVAVNKNKSLVLGKFTPKEDELEGNGNNDNNAVVNGINPSDAEKTLYTINLNDWYTKIENKDGVISSDNWQQPTSGRFSKTDGFSCKTGSVFGGEFVIPFLADDENTTLKLRLVNSTNPDGTNIKEWEIKLSNGYNKNITSYSGSGNDEWNTADELWKAGQTPENNREKYSILRNHLYAVGVKKTANPNDPDNPGPGEEEDPEPLNKSINLQLRVNDNWEFINHMVVED